MVYKYIIAAILEFLAILTIYYSDYYIISIIIHIVSIIILTKIFTKENFTNRNAKIIIFTLFLFIPIISFIIVGMIYFLNEFEIKDFEFEKMNILTLIKFEEIDFVKRAFGEGAVLEYVTNTKIPSFLRLKAFIVLSEYLSPLSIQLFKKGLSDPVDEVRMLSFNVINSKEKELNELVSKYKKENNNLMLATVYWEFIYYNLTDEIYSQILIKNILSLIDGKNEDELLLLLKVYLHIKDYQKLEEVLNKLPIDNKTAPYWLEVFYYKKEYEKIKEFIKRFPSIKYIQKFYYIKELWHDN